MMFEKKFKNFLNHREEFRSKAKRRRDRILKQRKDQPAIEVGEEYYDEEDVLSNDGSEN